MAPSAITPVVLRICAFGVDLKHARCAVLGVFANNAGTLRFFGAATGYSELLPKGTKHRCRGCAKLLELLSMI